MLREIKIALAAAALIGASFSANATVLTFDLFDSQAGSERPPNYGLRLDGLYSGDASDVYTFSFDDVTMKVDSDLDTARLSGTMTGGTEGDGEARTNSWLLDFTYTGLNVDSDGSWEFVTSSSGGSGSIESDYGHTFYLVEFMGSDGFGPDGDDVSCRTNDGPWCGNGWLNHSIDPNLTLAEATDNLNTHLAASDFLYNAVPVPEPGTLALLGLGIAGLSVARRRKA